MSGKDRVVIGKMIKYCEDSVKHIDGLDFESFIDNELVFTYSIFSLLQLGELVSNLSDDFKSKNKEIPWAILKSIRNRIAHDYEGVYDRAIWDALINDIPPLIEQLRKI